ncbi:MAG: hydantoinase B/oxoprolinase family protein, partial [Chloroflexota bacterium]|nr:hydantoinase B/oxoprolinase family protein [Chloroflexota bacterium]
MVDSILLELYRHRLSGVAEEMGVTLRRTSFSPNIKERLDFSCALFDGEGGLLAQAAHIPVHLGAMPASVGAALGAFSSWRPGDLVILNDPYQGGTHLPDITMVSPVFVEEGAGVPHFFLATRAHHADVGGMSPGSMPLSTEVYQEGIIIPPLKLDEGGRTNEGLLGLLLRNVRTPEERRGDLAAQRAAHAVGEQRLRALVSRHGLEEVLAYGSHLQAYSERLTRTAILEWPDGVYEAEEVLESGAEGILVPIRVRATIAGDEIAFDFAGTSPALPWSLNAVLSITQSACWYAVRCLVGEKAPVNGGCFAPVQVVAPEGSLVNAQPPAAVAGGNVETSQRIVDVVFKALAQPLPDRVAAAGQGTMNNLTIGGVDERAVAGQEGKAGRPTPFAYYETIGGGMGAHPEGDGLSGVHVHMSNTMNTPVEALERAYPFRLRRYEVRKGSGGRGKQHGGDGVIREYEMRVPCTVTMLSERRASAPYGLAGGEAGQPGRNVLIHRDGSEQQLPSKFSRTFQASERLRIETPGGGGWG